jgi:catechol 2,3-dioxygenase-like lactoylglutathione lyase family enzyme
MTKQRSFFIFFPVALLTIISANIVTVESNPASSIGTKNMAHVALVVKDIESTTRIYADLFGIDPPKIKLGSSPTYMGKPTGGRAKMAFIHLENISLEIFEPVDGPSAWQEFLDTKGEGVHHFGFWIEGMDKKVALFESKGMPVIQSGGGDWGRFNYIDATSGLAVMVELLEKNNSGNQNQQP